MEEDSEEHLSAAEAEQAEIELRKLDSSFIGTWLGQMDAELNEQLSAADEEQGEMELVTNERHFKKLESLAQVKAMERQGRGVVRAASAAALPSTYLSRGVETLPRAASSHTVHHTVETSPALPSAPVAASVPQSISMEPPASKCTCIIEDYDFVPKEMTVLVGGTVTWRMGIRGGQEYQITGRSSVPDLCFEGPLLERTQKQAFTHRFPAAGKVEVSCSLWRFAGIVNVVDWTPPEIPLVEKVCSLDAVKSAVGSCGGPGGCGSSDEEETARDVDAELIPVGAEVEEAKPDRPHKKKKAKKKGKGGGAAAAAVGGSTSSTTVSNQETEISSNQEIEIPAVKRLVVSSQSFMPRKIEVGTGKIVQVHLAERERENDQRRVMTCCQITPPRAGTPYIEVRKHLTAIEYWWNLPLESAGEYVVVDTASKRRVRVLVANEEVGIGKETVDPIAAAEVEKKLLEGEGDSNKSRKSSSKSSKGKGQGAKAARRSLQAPMSSVSAVHGTDEPGGTSSDEEKLSSETVDAAEPDEIEEVATELASAEPIQLSKPVLASPPRKKAFDERDRVLNSDYQLALALQSEEQEQRITPTAPRPQPAWEEVAVTSMRNQRKKGEQRRKQWGGEGAHTPTFRGDRNGSAASGWDTPTHAEAPRLTKWDVESAAAGEDTTEWGLDLAALAKGGNAQLPVEGPPVHISPTPAAGMQRKPSFNSSRRPDVVAKPVRENVVREVVAPHMEQEPYIKPTNGIHALDKHQASEPVVTSVAPSEAPHSAVSNSFDRPTYPIARRANGPPPGLLPPVRAVFENARTVQPVPHPVANPTSDVGVGAERSVLTKDELPSKGTGAAVRLKRRPRALSATSMVSPSVQSIRTEGDSAPADIIVFGAFDTEQQQEHEERMNGVGSKKTTSSIQHVVEPAHTHISPTSSSPSHEVDIEFYAPAVDVDVAPVVLEPAVASVAERGDSPLQDGESWEDMDVPVIVRTEQVTTVVRTGCGGERLQFSEGGLQPLPPWQGYASAFETEHAAPLRARWFSFEESIQRGYDTLPSGRQVPIVKYSFSEEGQ